MLLRKHIHAHPPPPLDCWYHGDIDDAIVARNTVSPTIPAGRDSDDTRIGDSTQSSGLFQGHHNPDTDFRDHSGGDVNEKGGGVTAAAIPPVPAAAAAVVRDTVVPQLPLQSSPTDRSSWEWVKLSTNGHCKVCVCV